MTYDAIIIGARCAGSPSAMLLARRGCRVLLVDRATFPSDTISTHLIHPPGVDALKRWGLLEPVVATGCPPIDTYSFDLGPFAIEGAPGHPPSLVSYAPRRTLLDKLLVDAAAEAGAEVREGFTVGELAIEDGRVTGIRGHSKGGQPVTERARVVIGADGINSVVAKAAGAAHYNEKPVLESSYYSYWSGLPMNGRFEGYDRGDRAFAVWPTNDDLTLVIVGWPYAEFESNKSDIEGNYHRALERVPAFASRMREARREDRFYGMAVPNFFRKPFGPGWALVGDAGYNRDFITAQGISDAFRDAELCVDAVLESFSGARSYDKAMSAYQKARDTQVGPMYEFTAQFASMTPPPPEQRQLMAAIHGNREAMNGFARVFAGVTSPAEFFSPQNVEKILGASL